MSGKARGMTEGRVVCATCGRTYGRVWGQKPVRAHKATLAAKMAGWQVLPNGRWSCGGAACLAGQDTPPDAA